MMCNILVTLNVFEWTFLYDTDSWNAEADIPLSWRGEILFLATINSVITLLWERGLVKILSMKWKNYRDHKEKIMESEENRYKPPGMALNLSNSQF